MTAHFENRIARAEEFIREQGIGEPWRDWAGKPVGEWPPEALSSLFRELARELPDGERSEAWDCLSYEDLNALLALCNAAQGAVADGAHSGGPDVTEAVVVQLFNGEAT